MKLSNLDIVKNDKLINDFPEVAVEQTNVRISDIIRRNLAGEQVLGTTKLAYDYLGTEQFTSMEVNPFNRMDFDLDDVILLADRLDTQIIHLQDEKGRLDKELIASKEKLKQAKEADVLDQAKKLEQAHDGTK